MANPRWAESSVPRYLPDRVAHLYYAHGLFCSSHPVIVILITSVVILLSSLPLSNLPLPGNVPQSFSTHVSQVNITPPRWYYGEPKFYVQQVILKSTVTPWNDNLLLTDAFRSPIAESFKLIEMIHNFQYNSSLSLDSFCLHVEGLKKKTNKMSSIFPEYNCLLLSPGNLWQQNFNKFQLDANLINTVFNYQNFAKGKISISEMLFGLQLKDAGVKRYPLRNKQRVIQFAVTIFMTEYDSLYVEGLQTYLKTKYPFTQNLNPVNNTSSQSYIHVYYPQDVNYGELVPLSVTYFILFLYMYFSVRKMEFIKSKICMAFCVVLTVLASLSITVGICFFFGLEFSGKERGKQVFPYLMIIVGLENALVLMKSVVSTTSHLDVKIRVAQGLSKEGWNITKNLLFEVTILTIGLFTFVPAIQEFCIFAVVGLLADFFLQVVFFSTVLSLNVKCTEQSPYPNYAYYSSNASNSSLKNTHVTFVQHIEDTRKLSRSRSHPRLTGANVIGPVRNHTGVASTEKMSKRIKVVHFWARTRFVQRSFMVGMVLWIAVIVYNADTIQNFLRMSSDNEVDEIVTSEDKHMGSDPIAWRDEHVGTGGGALEVEDAKMRDIKIKEVPIKADNSSDEYQWLKKVDYDTRRRLSFHHWSSILSLYNVTLTGSYITLLPPINLVRVISPEVAQSLRNPEEKGIRFRWQSLAIALDPIDFPDVESTVKSTAQESEEQARPLIPSSPMEIFMTALLCIVSVFVLAYAVVVLYRCICTRNYAEWRSSWTSSAADDPAHFQTQVVLEALPITIEGHPHLIECVSTDSNVVVSTCLGGFVRIWDTLTGELIVNIERKRSEFKGKVAPPNAYLSPANGSHAYANTRFIQQYNNQYQNISSVNVDYPVNSPKFNSFASSNAADLHLTSYTLDKRKNDEAVSPSSNYGGSNNGNFMSGRDHVIDDSQRPNVPIWCIDCKDNIVVLGCVDGCLEFWECTSGLLKCIYVDDGVSITSVKILGYLVITAKLNGTLSFYKLEVMPSYGNPTENTNGPTKHRKGHVRSGSVDSGYNWQVSDFDELRCYRVDSIKAHSKPITVLEAEGGRVVTGSEDRTLKVFLIENQVQLYSLHGHYGSISCLFIDRFNPSMAGSGSQDGLLCVWDLHTGTCMYSIQAHDGMIAALTYSVSYVISLGQDEKLCVWDRFQGHLLNTVPLVESYCTSLSMLTHNLLVTSKQGCLMILDVGTGETIRIVKLGPTDSCVFIRHILNLGDAIVCDYGDQLRLVRFPLVCDKRE